jgi:RNA polymerase sigma factor (sigma-70 family)
VPASTADSWRTWLVTGTRLVPLDLRRARGARGRLKKTLIDGPGSGAEPQHRWRDFSSAMDRQAVGEALSALPHQQREVVQLAYFGGMTNREIADRLGVPVGGVRHRLRRALATAGEYVDHGRATGKRVVLGLTALLCGRSFDDRTSGVATEHILRTAMIVAAGVTAGVVLGTNQAPVHAIPIEPAHHPSIQAAIPAAPAARPNTSVVSDASNQVSGVPSVPVTVSVPSQPIKLSIPVPIPSRVGLPIPVVVTIPVPLPIPTPNVPPLP